MKPLHLKPLRLRAPGVALALAACLGGAASAEDRGGAGALRRQVARLDHQIATLVGIRDRLAGCIGCGCQSLDDCQVFNPNDEAAAQGPGAHWFLKDGLVKD